MTWQVFNEPDYVFGSGSILTIQPAPRKLTIGNVADEYGFIVSSIGALVSNLWFDEVNTITRLFIDNSSHAVILRASDDSQWGGLNQVTLRTEGFADISLTYNGTFYNVINIDYSNYITSQLGNTLDVNILPETS